MFGKSEASFAPSAVNFSLSASSTEREPSSRMIGEGSEKIRFENSLKSIVKYYCINCETLPKNVTPTVKT